MLPFIELIRLLAHIALCANFKMYSVSRIAELECLIQKFGKLLLQVKQFFPEKGWEFPKVHQLAHLVDDIKRKGCPYYFSMIIGENFHQGLIQHYECSNKKDAARQVSL